MASARLRGFPELAYIWQIAATFRAHDDGEWSREKCIEALSQIADYTEELAESLLGKNDPLADMAIVFAGDGILDNLRREFAPYS